MIGTAETRKQDSIATFEADEYNYSWLPTPSAMTLSDTSTPIDGSKDSILINIHGFNDYSVSLWRPNKALNQEQLDIQGPKSSGNVGRGWACL